MDAQTKESQTEVPAKNCTVSVLQTRSKRRRLCNELICEVCEMIPLAELNEEEETGLHRGKCKRRGRGGRKRKCTCPPPVEEKLAAVGREKILVTSFNICTYLGERFRKKLVRDVIAFAKTKLHNGGKVAICIDRTSHHSQDEHFVMSSLHSKMLTCLNRHVHEQLASENAIQIQFGHLRIRMCQNRDWQNICLISSDVFDNVHVQYFFRSIAPLIQPIKLSLLNFSPANLTSLLNSLGPYVNVIEVDVQQFILEPVYTAFLSKHNKLSIICTTFKRHCQREQFSRTFIQWLNGDNDGQPKFCDFSLLFIQELAPLLAKIKENFFAANSKCSFVVHFPIFSTEAGAEPFSVRNSIGEQLELQHKFDLNWHNYLLIRRPITQMDDNNSSVGLHFDGFRSMSKIEWHSNSHDDHN